MIRLSLRSHVALVIATFAASPLAAQGAAGINVRNDAARKEIVVELGPVDLPAGSGHLQLPALHAAFPVDGWLHGFRVEMVDAQGREVPRRTLHHVNMMSPQRRELFSQIMLRIAAAGQETDGPRLPRMMGYRVSAGDEFIITAMLTNPTGQDIRGVRVRMIFPYTGAGTWLKPMAVLPFYLDVMPPASLHSFPLSPGRNSRSWEGRPAVAGRIIGLSGHLHRYGVSLVLEDVTAGEVIWDGRPILDQDGEVAGMPTRKFIWRLGFPVRPDHVYRITATYENPSGEVIDGGGMGALGGVFLPDEESDWPGIDRNHAELKLDWELVHTAAQRAGGGHAGHGSTPAPAPAHGADGHSHGAPAARPAQPARSTGGNGSTNR